MTRGTWLRAMTAAVAVGGTLVAVPSGHATALSSGEGFDTCAALTTSAMRSTTGYHVANIYIGGLNRSCAQPDLTPSWVSTVAGAGWTLLPTYVGKQAPCTDATGVTTMSSDPATARGEGSADADDAATSMAGLGLGSPNVVYADMEAYNPSDTACAVAVAAYLDGFIAESHAKGYRAGVYGSTGSTVKQLVAAYDTSSRQRPDDIWIANPDNNDTTADPSVPATYWAGHRVRQYTAGSSIDNDAVAGDTAVPSGDALPPYVVSGTGSTTYVRERSTPSTGGTDMQHDPEGTALAIDCQTTGDNVGGTSVWDKLQDGNYVSDLYTSTPGGLGFAGTLPRCDNTPTARITSPATDATVVAGTTVTVHVAVPVAATSVEVAVSTDNGSTWRTAGASNTATGGVYAVSFAAPAAVGTTVKLQATVSGSGTTWSALNEPVLHVVAPLASLAAVAAGTTAASYVFRWSGQDGSSRPSAYDVRYERAAWNGGFGSWATSTTAATTKALALAEGYDYCVEVRARGVLGEIGPWTAPRCVGRVLDDRALTASRGWTRGTHSGYYDGTYTSTKTSGATLVRSGAVVARVGVLATTCAGCGRVGVYVGRTLVGSVNLYSARTHLQQLFTVRAFSVRSGTVTLRVLTSGKLVQIDGILLTRT